MSAIEVAAKNVGHKLRSDWPLLGVVPATGMHVQMQATARLLVLLVLVGTLLWQVTHTPIPKSTRPKALATSTAPRASAGVSAGAGPQARKVSATKIGPKKAPAKKTVPAQRGGGAS